MKIFKSTKVGITSFLVIIGVSFTGCVNTSSPRPNVLKYIEKHKLSKIPQDKNLEILGLANKKCTIQQIEAMLTEEYKAYSINSRGNKFFIGKGRIYKAATRNPTSSDIGKCYGALRMQQGYGRYRTSQEAKWYVNECIKGFKKIKTFDERIKIQHKLKYSDNLETIKLNVYNANINSRDMVEIGIYKVNNKKYVYSILPSFANSKMKNFDSKIKANLIQKCTYEQISIPYK